MKGLLGGRALTAAAVATVALMAAGGGYAVAGSSSGTVAVCVSRATHALYRGKCHRHDGTLRWSKTGPQGPRGLQGRQGNPGNPGNSGNPGGPGVPGTAKAYGLFESDGTLDTARSRNITASSKPGNGVYCVGVSGASSTTEAAVVTPDLQNDTLSGNSLPDVEVASGGPGCPAGQFEFLTYSVTASASGLAITSTDEGFSFVIP